MDYGDYSGQAWDEFHIMPTITNYFKILAISVYRTCNNGFAEIEVYGIERKDFN